MEDERLQNLDICSGVMALGLGKERVFTVPQVVAFYDKQGIRKTHSHPDSLGKIWSCIYDM